MTIIFLRTGHAYRVADSLTLTQVNDKLNTNPDRFIEVPLYTGPGGAAIQAGTPGEGWAVTNLFITPSSVSHFVVL